MRIEFHPDKRTLGARASAEAAGRIRSALDARGQARIIAATGASQFDFLDSLTRAPNIDWQRVTMFHLDEYVGLADSHPASFRRYLRERLIDRVPLGKYFFLNPELGPKEECGRVGGLLQERPIDVAFVGIGENGHLAFNDPPADFETEEPYLIVTLDERCRRQQMGEGWFARFDDVPERAVSMSIRQILRSRSVLCIVPEARKAEAVKATVEGPISPMVPASILRTHPDTILFLDADSAARLSAESKRER